MSTRAGLSERLTTAMRFFDVLGSSVRVGAKPVVFGGEIWGDDQISSAPGSSGQQAAPLCWCS